MTLIHGMSTRGQLEESTALQRRLLQDLERQWLDTWGQADQLREQAAPADGQRIPTEEAAAPAEKPGMGKLEASSLRAAPAATRAARDMTKTSEAPTDGVPMPGQSPPDAGAARQSVDHPIARRGACELEPTSTVGESAEAVGGKDLSGSRRLTEQAAASGFAGAAGLTAAERPDRPHPPRLEKGVREGGVQASPVARTAAVPGAFEPDASKGVAAAPVAAAVKTLATPALAARQPLPSAEAREADAEVAKASTKRLPTASVESEPTPHHLMLREINEQEVLASMRDARLDAHESQLAAQGLARALMQAGYARVQVVVNGQQQWQDGTRPTDEATPATGLGQQSTALESTNTEAARHGHQR